MVCGVRARRIGIELPAVVLAAAVACDRGRPPEGPPMSESSSPASAADPTEAARHEMVRSQIAARGVRDAGVLEAMRRVPRHAFVPDHLDAQAYDDRPLPIGEDQTISQPYIVAAMTELAAAAPGRKILEIGTGSGYQAAVLAEVGATVYSIEIVEPLAARARQALAQLGYDVHLRVGDGYAGWPEVAPFDAILVTAAPPEVPRPLLLQLAIGGRLVVPVGPSGGRQELLVITRKGEDEFVRDTVFPVSFVPMTGEAQRAR
jgi:protein-L-isoaspartate(D-aspartate) O-methyltransferase